MHGVKKRWQISILAKDIDINTLRTNILPTMISYNKVIAEGTKQTVQG